MDIFLLDIFFVFCVSFASLLLFRKVAFRLDLLDKPSHRKHHQGSIPLIGGVAICFSVIHFLYFNPLLGDDNTIFIFSILLLTLLGALDDRFDISFRIRFLVQALLAVVMAQAAEIMICDLGNMFGFGQIELHLLSIPITVLAVIGAINAFNMVDGIDGLLGGLSLVTFSGIAALMLFTDQLDKFYLCLIFVTTMIPYILMNLGLVGRERKVFMGDAGSMMIGFTVIWLLLGASQEHSHETIRPVTCLWLIALPLMDMASIMIRRIKKGRSPFHPDREHLHHIFQKYGFTSTQTLAIICFFASVMATVGVVGEIYQIHEPIMFWGFIATFCVYNHLLVVFGRGAKLREQQLVASGK